MSTTLLPWRTMRLSSCWGCMYHGRSTPPTEPGERARRAWMTRSIPSIRGRNSTGTKSKETPSVLRKGFSLMTRQNLGSSATI